MPLHNTLRRPAHVAHALALGGGLLLALICAHAQDVVVTDGTPNPGKTEPLPHGSVTGHVTCDDTHGPARAARVMLFPADPHGANALGGQPLFATTHLDGSFILPHVAPGEYLAIAMAAGYLSPLDGVMLPQGAGSGSQQQEDEVLKQLRAAAPSVNVTDEGAARVDIDIRRGAVLTGRVLYSDGTPASQIAIQVQNVNEPKSGPKAAQMIDVGSFLRMVTVPHNLTTDDLGDFRLAGIAPGTYRLAVPQSFESSSIQDAISAVFNPNPSQSAKLTIYSGNTLHKKDAKTYELRAGDTVSGIEITLPLNGLHTIKGIAAGKNGIVLNSGSLDLTDTVDDSITFHTTIRGEGEFAFYGIPEGSYTLKLTNGFTRESPIPDNVPDEMISSLNQQQMYRPTHAFSDLTQSVLLGADDIDNLALTPTEAKLPDPPTPNPADQPDPSQPPASPDR
jgi:hypothetical protein